MSAALTPWFPADVKPEKIGCYEFENMTYPFHYWDGSKWLGSGAKPADWEVDPTKAEEFDLPCRWRGLAADPSVTP